MSKDKFMSRLRTAVIEHGQSPLQQFVTVVTESMEMGFTAGWNAALLELDTEESRALLIRCEQHGAVLGIETCEHKEMMQ